MKKIAVVLCGSGFKDGSEIRESVATLWALSKEKAEVSCFAPDAPQADVINCLTGEPVPGETRNMLVEAARIARGEIQSLSRLDPTKIDALIIPGGFGAAKNLCNFAKAGGSGNVLPALKEIIQILFKQKKPIGAICIAPVIVAMALKGAKLRLTLGAPGYAADEIEKMGHTNIVVKADECLVDKDNIIVSSPAYMYGDAKLAEVFTGIEKLVREVVSLA